MESRDRRKVSRTTAHPSPAQMGADRRHYLLSIAPASACAEVRRTAAFLRGLDAKISKDGLIPPHLPSVYVRVMEACQGERFGVERSIEQLARWAYDHDVAPEGTPVLGFARPFLPIEMRRPSEQARKEAICRVLYDLIINGRDSNLTRAVRALAQEAFHGAGAMDALVRRTARDNSDIVGVPMGEGMLHWAPSTASRHLAVPTGIAVVMNRAQAVTHFLRRLDFTIRVNCLFAPYDHAPRGGRHEQVLYLADLHP